MSDVGAAGLMIVLLLLVILRALKPCWLGEHRIAWGVIYKVRGGGHFVMCRSCHKKLWLPWITVVPVDGAEDE